MTLILVPVCDPIKELGRSQPGICSRLVGGKAHLHVRKWRDIIQLISEFEFVQTHQYYQAIATRDRRFDGRFFVGVKSTGIYCRPICRSRRPLLKHCEFFRLAAAAEAAGFRPCLRCRPELAPGQAPIDSADRLTFAAVKQIEAGALTDGNVASLAQSLGVSDRHLRRVLLANLGVTPVQLAQTQRLLLAKQLLTDTSLSMIDVAFASGFSSLRRFNALFRERYRIAPSRLRAKPSKNREDTSCSCRLPYRTPFDWDSLLSFFSRRMFAGVEAIENGEYRRTVRIGKHEGWIAVQNDAANSMLRLVASVTLLPVLMDVRARVRRLFDLDADPETIAAHLGDLVNGHIGLRVPGAFDGFEMAIRAILGQQISVSAASTFAARLTKRFGKSIQTPFPGLTHLAPTAKTLATAEPEELLLLGITRTRAKSIQSMAQAVLIGAVSLDVAVSIETALNQLKTLPGIGDWTAHYFAMRIFGWPDAFPHSDLGVLKALKTTKPREALSRAESWRPWRAYAAMHLWNSLGEPVAPKLAKAEPSRADRSPEAVAKWEACERETKPRLSPAKSRSR